MNRFSLVLFYLLLNAAPSNAQDSIKVHGKMFMYMETYPIAKLSSPRNYFKADQKAGMKFEFPCWENDSLLGETKYYLKESRDLATITRVKGSTNIFWITPEKKKLQHDSATAIQLELWVEFSKNDIYFPRYKYEDLNSPKKYDEYGLLIQEPIYDQKGWVIESKVKWINMKDRFTFEKNRYLIGSIDYRVNDE
jgi:hypothetical protein